jgi:hypothetical protein
MMNHLDVGFDGINPIIGFAYNVVNKYFDVYYPNAIKTALDLRELPGPERLIYTTHPWLVSLYLDCPSDSQWGSLLHCPNATAVAAFRAAVLRGDIAWHAFPFNTEPELYDPSLFASALQIAQQLNVEFGFNKTTLTMSQRDVPGMTRSVLPVLYENGIRALTFGVNGESSPPSFPSAFVWRDNTSGVELLGMMHPGGYGGFELHDMVIVPNFEHALVPFFKGDNHGPPNAVEVIAVFAAVKLQLPSAQVMASTWDNFVIQLETVKSQLPVFTQEMGDTWIYGVASDPLRLMQYREILRLRKDCVDAGVCNTSDINFRHFDRFLMKIPEHTWGLDTKLFLGDWSNWSNEAFQKVLPNANFQLMVTSWIEQRSFLDNAIAFLGQTAFASTLNASMASFQNIVAPATSAAGFVRQTTPLLSDQVYTAGRFSISFDNETGAIISLVDSFTGHQWANALNPLAQFSYTTYGATDFNTFLSEYSYPYPTPSWATYDFGKPNITASGAVSDTWLPSVQELWTLENSTGYYFQLLLSMPANTWQLYGAPQQLWVTVALPGDDAPEGLMNVSITVLNKTSTRLPEALFFKFDPLLPAAADNWWMDKLGQLVNPMEVMLNGSRHLHAIRSGVYYTPPAPQNATLGILSPDAAVVCMGAPTAFPTPLTTQPDLTQGLSFILYDNLWGTNYIMWYPYLPSDSNIRYRFQLAFGAGAAAGVVGERASGPNRKLL